MYTIGYDIGSSFIKCTIFNVETGTTAAAGSAPASEMTIHAQKPGWAEQDPETWWENVRTLTRKLLADSKIPPEEIRAVGISYQMHGLVCTDRAGKSLRPSIIWCDSRAVEIGSRAAEALGHPYTQTHLLNSPGNFTASKLKWVKDNEPDVFRRIDKIMLPGDYIALKLTGEPVTTVSGLSEGIFWDFRDERISEELLAMYGFEKSILPPVCPTFSIQGYLTKSAASELGLSERTAVSYRAGDQPNNAFSRGNRRDRRHLRCCVRRD